MEDYFPDLDEFCRREYPRLVGSLALYTGEPELACELAQETLARACRDWKRVGAMAAPGAWVHRVGMNLAKSSFRRRAIERRVMRRPEVAPDQIAAFEQPEAVVQLEELLAELPRRQRAAIVLRYYADLSITDTAEAMGCAPGTVTALCSQAVARLRSSGESGHDAPRLDAPDEEVRR